MVDPINTPSAIPAADIAIDLPLVRALLQQQHPDLAEQPLSAAESGWDNVIYRLGATLAVRLPRRQVAADLILHEQACLSLLAGKLPLPIPAPLRIGTPGSSFPWHWSVVPWLAGTAADLIRPAATEARSLAEFLRALHHHAPDHVPGNQFRGVPLRERAQVTEARLRRLEMLRGPLPQGLRRIWEDALRAAESRQRKWLHGDLHSRNVLCIEGRISGIIDWGDVGAGDCATDLAAIWMLFDCATARERAMTFYDTDAASWARGRGWALALGVLLAGLDDPIDGRYRAIGDATLRNLLEGP
jgi:aminoglycoside phosphotransferase (APT) family kinase protein